MSIIIEPIDWEQIQNIWHKDLWPNRQSAIETHSAMLYLGGYNMLNFSYEPIFLGCFKDQKLVGVNSGHGCADKSFRSRGLWVSPDYRGQGIGRALLAATIDRKGNSDFVWSYPRQTSWNTYKAVGFQLTSDWQASETSDANAYCRLG